MPDCSSDIKTGAPPSPECLALAAQHIVHDLELFELAWTERHTRLGWSMWFILARSLTDFLFRSERAKGYDDILSTDFPASQPWEPLASDLVATAKKLPEYEAVRTAANKNSAHLTYDRTDEMSPGRIGPSEAVHRFLQGAAREWLSRLEPEVRVWFGK